MDATRASIKTLKRLEAMEKLLFAIAKQVGVDPNAVFEMAQAQASDEVVSDKNSVDTIAPDNKRKVGRGKGE